MLNSNNYLNKYLPNQLKVKYAEGDRIIADNNEIYYSYFNNSLRWLCGYNNQDINNLIDKDIETIKTNPDSIKEIQKQVKATFVQNLGNEYNDILFLEGNTYEYFYHKLSKKNDKYFLKLGDIPNFPGSLHNKILDFFKLLSLEKDVKGKLTEEGFNIKKIKNIFKHFKDRLAALIISPLSVTNGSFLSIETLELIFKLAKKNKITIVWDETDTVFFRSGTFYLLNQYELVPDFVTININLFDDRFSHIIIAAKKIKKKFFKFTPGLKATQNAIPLIVLHATMIYIANNNVPQYVERISHRLTHKLTALSANIHGRFKINAIGLIIFINLDNDILLERLSKFLISRKIILETNSIKTLFLLPQLDLSIRAVDLFIQTMDDFYKSGIKLPSTKKN